MKHTYVIRVKGKILTGPSCAMQATITVESDTDLRVDDLDARHIARTALVNTNFWPTVVELEEVQ